MVLLYHKNIDNCILLVYCLFVLQEWFCNSMLGKATIGPIDMSHSFSFALPYLDLNMRFHIRLICTLLCFWLKLHKYPNIIWNYLGCLHHCMCASTQNNKHQEPFPFDPNKLTNCYNLEQKSRSKTYVLHYFIYWTPSALVIDISIMWNKHSHRSD